MAYLDDYDPDNLLRPQDVDLDKVLTLVQAAKEYGFDSSSLYRFCKNYRGDKGLWKLPHVLIGKAQMPFVTPEAMSEFKESYVPWKYHDELRKRPKGSGDPGSAEAS